MKKITIITVIVGFLYLSMEAFPKAGPPIPVPKISITKAVEIAKNHFYKKDTRVKDADYFKIHDYILISAQWTNHFNEKYQKEWAWKIVFVHPIQNDHSVGYKVTNGKQIILLYVTE